MTTIPTPPDTFANPFIACAECGRRVTNTRHNPAQANLPCGHQAEADTVCPSWGPVDGCRCLDSLGHVPHGTPRS